jgi:hypothetical protein
MYPPPHMTCILLLTQEGTEILGENVVRYFMRYL